MSEPDFSLEFVRDKIKNDSDTIIRFLSYEDTEELKCRSLIDNSLIQDGAAEIDFVFKGVRYKRYVPKSIFYRFRDSKD